MKLSELINAWGPTVGAICLAVAMILLWERKHELPDHYEPITVEEANTKIEPLLFAAKVSVYNNAIRNIPYSWDQICFPPEFPNDEARRIWRKTWKDKIKFEYKNHIWGNNEPHEYASMTEDEICALRKAKKEREDVG